MRIFIDCAPEVFDAALRAQGPARVKPEPQEWLSQGFQKRGIEEEG